MILLFDCFGTILDYKAVDFEKGLRFLYEKFFKDKCTYEELQAYNLELFHEVEELHKSEIETAFVKGELPLYAKKFGTKPLYMSPSEEADFMLLTTELDNFESLPGQLEELYNQGVAMYVLSNSIYSSEGLKSLLDRFEIGKYFRNVWSSSDFGKIKPNKEFFMMGIQNALSENPGESMDSIVYVGDTYEADVEGATRAGVRSIWINHKEEEDTKGIATRIITKHDQFMEAVKSL